MSRGTGAIIAEMASQSTRELIEQVRSGVPEARERLVDAHRHSLSHFIRRRVGDHLQEVVEFEDIFQETFAKAFQSIDGFQWRGEDSFLRWLKRICENAILAQARRQRRARVLYVEEHEAPSELPSPSRLASRDERLERLQKALRELDPEHREVIVLARLKGHRLKDVARRMNRSPNAVAHLLSRALTRLKDLFGDTESYSLPPERLDLERREHEDDA